MRINDIELKPTNLVQVLVREGSQGELYGGKDF